MKAYHQYLARRVWVKTLDIFPIFLALEEGAQALLFSGDDGTENMSYSFSLQEQDPPTPPQKKIKKKETKTLGPVWASVLKLKPCEL